MVNYCKRVTHVVFGEYLVKNGIISHDQLKAALLKQDELDIPIGEALVSLSFVEKENLESHLNDYMALKADELLEDYAIWHDHK